MYSSDADGRSAAGKGVMQNGEMSEKAEMMTEKMERKGNNLKPEGRGKPDIRMIALDLDGTALDRKMRVTERTVRAMEEAARRGVQVVISTGRTYHTLPEQLREIRGLDYAVTSNGAIINRLKTGEVLYRNCLPREAVEQAAEIFRREGVGAGADGAVRSTCRV